MAFTPGSMTRALMQRDLFLSPSDHPLALSLRLNGWSPLMAKMCLWARLLRPASLAIVVCLLSAQYATFGVQCPEGGGHELTAVRRLAVETQPAQEKRAECKLMRGPFLNPVAATGLTVQRATQKQQFKKSSPRPEMLSVRTGAGLSTKEIHIMADDRSGVIDASKTYDEKALLDLLGCSSTGAANRRKWLLRHFLHAGLPIVRVGNKYLISGHKLHLWVQDHSRTWEEWQEDDGEV